MLMNGRIVELAEPSEFVNSSQDEVRLFLESQFITRRGDWEKDIT
jgi:hypothetical protein